MVIAIAGMGVVCCLHCVYCGSLIPEICGRSLFFAADSADRPAFQEDGDTDTIVHFGGNVCCKPGVRELIDIDEQFCVCEGNGALKHPP